MSDITPEVPAVKTCKKCEQVKPIDDFPLLKTARGVWRLGACRICTNAQKLAWAMKRRGAPAPFVDLPLEEWRPVPGFEDRYDVSNLGRVRSWQNPHGRLVVPYLKIPTIDSDGYLYVGLYEKKKGKHCRVSRLVLMAFVGLPDVEMEASHLDGDATNNRLDNLAWETRLENEQHKNEHGTRPRGESQYLSKLTEEQVKEIRRLRNLGFKLAELAKRYGLYETAIHKICKRETWKHVP